MQKNETIIASSSHKTMNTSLIAKNVELNTEEKVVQLTTNDVITVI